MLASKEPLEHLNPEDVPGEESCLSLVWAVLDLQINNTCNGVKLSDIDRKKLYRLRHEPAEPEAEEKEVVVA